MKLTFYVYCFIGFLPIAGFGQDTAIVKPIDLPTSSLFTDTAQNDTTEAASLRNTVSEELKFVSYLVSNNQYDDALLLLYKMDTVEMGSGQKDSISYFTGWIEYFNQRFEAAIAQFEEVDTASALFYHAAFYNSFCHAYTGKPFEAQEILEGLDLDSASMLWNFRNFQLAGIALLTRDYEAFVSYSAKFSASNYLFSKEEKSLLTYAEDMQNYKKKSPFLAGLISAGLPGMGKFYAGYRGIPFGALVTTLPLAAVASEALIIAGALSPQFIILGSVFAVFYIGNIWGSVLSVKAKEREFYAEMDHNILFDMHIPLRRVFE